MTEPLKIAPVPIGALDDAPAASRVDLILARPYRFKMVGNSMSPRYRDGETIYVDPALPPAIDEDHVFLNEQRHAIVGTLLEMITPDTWRIAQWREKGDEIDQTILQLSVSEWPLIHRITRRRMR